MASASKSGDNAGGTQFLTVAEVASLMRVSKMTVYRLVHNGELPAVRVGRSFRVHAKAARGAPDAPGRRGGPVRLGRSARVRCGGFRDGYGGAVRSVVDPFACVLAYDVM
jgi:excisionase family DNA binding protein